MTLVFLVAVAVLAVTLLWLPGLLLDRPSRRVRLDLVEALEEAPGIGFQQAHWTSLRTALTVRTEAGRIRIRWGGGSDPRVLLRLEPDPPLPEGFRLAGHLWDRPGASAGRTDPYGDPALSNLASLAGPQDRADELLVRLDRETRQLLVDLLRSSRPGEARIEGGILTVVPHGTNVEVPILQATIQRMVALVGRLARPIPDVPRRLAELAEEDPEVEFRLRCLDLLWLQYPDLPATRRLGRRALTEEVPKIRFWAAIRQEEEGGPVLRELVGSAETPEEIRTEALRLLSNRLPDGELEQVLWEALEVSSSRPRSVLIRRLIQLQPPTLGQDLMRIDPTTSSVPLAAVAAEGLGLLGGDAVEPRLLELLERGEEEIRRPTLEALGRWGTLDSMAALRRIQEDGAQPESIRRSARRAAGEVWSRQDDGGAGLLSLAEPSDRGGGLSLTPEAGSLELPLEEEEPWEH